MNAKGLSALILLQCAVLAGCNSLSGFYVDGGLAVQDVGEARVVPRQITTTSEHNSVMETDTYNVRVLDTSSQNPYGRLAIGYDFQIAPRFTGQFEVQHVSSIATNEDRGTNSASFSVRWRPFAF